MGKSIVNIKLMGDALRNTGYKSIDSAVAEIVDNSIEAQAKNIFTIINDDINETTGRRAISEIAFLDNGTGMSKEILSECLGIGSTTKTQRKGMGRFGVGLPQASLYACPEVEVYSWQNGIKNCMKVSLNINKVKSGEQTEIEDPISVDIPEEYKKYLTYKEVDKTYDFRESGTLVLWKNYDRQTPKTSKALIEKLEFSLGQKFRYFIAENTCEIKIICHKNEQMNHNILPNDPLMLLPNNYVLGNINDPKKAYYPNEQKDRTDLVPIFEPYTNEMNQTGEVDVDVRYYDKDGKPQTGKVKIKFSIVKTEFYDKTAIKEGRNPGHYEIGKHIRDLEGISIIRANREIDFRNFDFYTNINTPQHRWWGCEVHFDPCMDEAFGVANNKQYVELKKVDEEDFDLDGEEILPMWLQLKRIIEPTIKNMTKRNASLRSTSKTNESNNTIEQPLSVDIINEIEEKNSENSVSKNQKQTTAEKEIIEKIQEKYNLNTEEARKFAKNSISITYRANGELNSAFDYQIELGIINININTSHIFYTSFLDKIYQLDESIKTTFELFLASFVKAIDLTSCINDEQRKANERLVTKWLSKITEYTHEQCED